MTDLTPEGLEELKRLLDAATPGPWRIAEPDTAESPFVLCHGDGDSLASFEPCGPWMSSADAIADLSLTVALRNAAPALIRAAEENKALERALRASQSGRKEEFAEIETENTQFREKLTLRNAEVVALKAEIADVRGRMEKAERVVEAARPYLPKHLDVLRDYDRIAK